MPVSTISALLTRALMALNGNLIQGTGDPYASFLLGQVSSSNFSIPAFSDYRRPYFAPWINDDWKVTDKLTLSFGFPLRPAVPAY